MYCSCLDWHSPCCFQDASPIYWDHYGFWCCHVSHLQPFPWLSQCTLSVLPLNSANESTDLKITHGAKTFLAIPPGFDSEALDYFWERFFNQLLLTLLWLCWDHLSLIYYETATQKKSVKSLLKCSDASYLLDPSYSIGSYLVRKRNHINLPWTELFLTNTCWLLASRELFLAIHDQNIPIGAQQDFSTQHGVGVEHTAGTRGRGAIWDAILSFLQITVKGVTVFKEEPAVILPPWVCFIQWENSSWF